MSLEKILDLMITIERCYIFGSCSGLLLLYIGGLFIANPITKKFRILDYSGSQLISKTVDGDSNCPKNIIAHMKKAMCVGFAVNRNQTTMRFKIVCIIEMKKKYAFEISDGYSWRLSETTITTISNSKLMTQMKPVYLDDTLHWLRNDGSIIAFNPETEQARLIPSRFHDQKLFLAADDEINRLTLISGTIETISVYTLLGDSKWALAKRIKNISMDKNLYNWDIIAYDGRCLVVRERNIHTLSSAHVYDIEANSWRISGSAIYKYATVENLYKFTPSLFFVEEDEQQKLVVASNDQRIPSLTAILRLIDTTK